MGGLGLIHLGFLAAGLAVAVPVLIHLLLRPRARRVEIGSVRFLKLALKESTRRRKLRRWLLLALRSLAVLLLALLFARPYLSGARVEGRDREVILLIDQSASMAALQGGQTLFARAQEAAEKLLKGLPEHTVVHVAYFDSDVAPAHEPRIDHGRRAGYGATDYDMALRWARDQILLSPRRQREVVLLTDLQRSGLRGNRSPGFPPDVGVQVVEVGKTLVRNLAVIRAEAVQTTLRGKEPVLVASHVRNAGPFAAKDVRVRLALEGPGPKIEQTQTVLVAAVAQQEVRFSVPVQTAGIWSGFVEIGDNDDFSLDNRRWLAFEVRPADRLLLVDGEPGRTVYANETYYLEAALRLRLQDKDAPLTPYEPERLPWNDVAKLPVLTPYRAVILCNVSQLAEADVKGLAAFVSGGGGLLLFTGAHVQPAGYEPLLRLGLLPATVEGSAGPDLFRFGTWNKEHPIFKPLSDPQQGDLRRLAFHHITRLKPVDGATVLAATPNGEPLLVERRLGEGKVLLLASAASRAWGDWPQTRLYLPLVHQLVGYLTERLPENQRVQVAPTGPGGENAPGITRNGRAAVVRNLDPAESEIERLTVEQFREAFHLPASDGETKRAQTAAASLLPGSLRPDEVWVWIVWIMLLVLVVELFVANRSHS